MFPKLSWKLTFFMVLVSGLTIAFASVLTNRALDRQFVDFLETSQLERNQQVVQTVRELYQGDQDRITIERQLQLLGLATDAQIVVSELRAERRMGGHMMSHGPGMMRRQTTENLTLPDGTVAVIEIIPSQRPEHAIQETKFRQAVNNSILVTAVLSIGAALIVSAFFSWGLTKPLDQLVAMVRRVGAGDLAQRTEVGGRDEFSYLGQEFNQMAANLEHMEQLRIKLTNDVAHEFRTPLAAVQAYVEAMSDGVVEPTAENLNLVLEEAHRLQGLLEGLQELSKLEQPPRKERVDLGELLTSLVASLGILAEEKGIRLHWYGQPALYTMGDREMLNTALRNLVVNAIKYTPPGGEVSIDLRAEQDQVLVEISDTGIGIEAQDLPFIFERFYRTDLSRSRETGGTGIGLAVTAGIIQGHGGTITVQSEPGVGSSFKVRLVKS